MVMVDPRKRRKLAIIMSMGRGGGRPRISFSGTIEEGATTGRAVGTATLANPPEDIGALTWSELGTGTGAALFAIDGSTGAVTNTAAIDYETATSYTYGIQVTDGVYTYQDEVTINVTNVFEAASLSALTLDDTDIPQGSAATINIGSATTGSTITLLSGSLPAGLTLNSGARTITGTPTTVAAASSFTLRETLADSANSPRDTVFAGITVSDATAPTLSSPTDAASGATAANISVSTDEANGTLYWYISTSATPPSAADLKAGTGAVTSGNQAVSATGIQSASASGLTAETAYYTYFLHRDAAGNDSSIAAADGFTTAASGGGSTAGEPIGLLLALLKAA